MPKYPNINTTLDWSEDPESVEEGIFFQPEEAATIDQALAAGITAAANLETVNGQVTDLNGQITTLNATITQNTTTINTQQQRITELEAEVATLGGQSSGEGTNVPGAKKDEVVSENKKTSGALPRYDSPEHPANAAADKYVPAAKKTT